MLNLDTVFELGQSLILDIKNLIIFIKTKKFNNKSFSKDHKAFGPPPKMDNGADQAKQ